MDDRETHAPRGRKEERAREREGRRERRRERRRSDRISWGPGAACFLLRGHPPYGSLPPILQDESDPTCPGAARL